VNERTNADSRERTYNDNADNADSRERTNNDNADSRE
jgi:hypothetical protein